MMTSRLTTERIIAILHGHAAGAPASDLVRRHDIWWATRYQWKTQWGDLEVSDTKRLDLPRFGGHVTQAAAA